MKKRILSLLLAATMLLSLVPMAVSASGNVTLSGTLSADTGYDNVTGDFYYISQDVIYNEQTAIVQIAIKNTQNGIGTFDADINLNNSVILVGSTYIWFEEVQTSFVGNAEGLTGSMVGKDGNTYVISLQKSTPTPEIAVYTVAGASDLMGSEWDPTDNANNMTDMGDGSFQLVKENVVLSAGDYMYKVVSDHTWGTGDFPQDGGNKTLTIAENGTYTVTFTFVPANADLSATADKLSYHYTEYANWQIKYGNTWEWSGDMEKVEDGLFKIEIWWEGTGINVKSDENPIKKDWFAPEELTLGDEVIAPVNVDVYLKVIDDETVRIGVGVIPEDPAPAHTHTFTYTADNGKITATCTEGCDKGYDTTPLTLTLTAPASLAYDGNVKAFTFADGEADAWTGAGLELPTIYYYIKQSGQSTYMPLFGTLKSEGDYMAEITVDGKDAQVYFSIVSAEASLQTGDGTTYYKTLTEALEEAGKVTDTFAFVYLLKDLPELTEDITVPETALLNLNHHIFRPTGSVVNDGAIVFFKENADIMEDFLRYVPGSYGVGEKIAYPNEDSPIYVLPESAFFTTEFGADIPFYLDLSFAIGDEPLVWNAEIPAGLQLSVVNNLALGGDVIAPMGEDIKSPLVTVTGLTLNNDITIGSNVETDGQAAIFVESYTSLDEERVYGSLTANGHTITLNATGKFIVSSDVEFDASVLLCGVEGKVIRSVENEEDGTVTYFVGEPDPEILLGDVDGNGDVNMKDVLALRRHIANLDTPYCEQNADANGDGEVDMKDVLAIREYIAHIIPALGARGGD